MANPQQKASHIFGDCLATVVVGCLIGGFSIGILLHGFAATLNAVGDAVRAVLGS